MKSRRSYDKTPGEKHEFKNIRGMGLKPIANKQVMKTQPL